MSEAQERYEYDPDYDEEPTEDAWTIRKDVFSRRYLVETVDKIGTRIIADCNDEDRARLIAAAPDMLKALKLCKHQIQEIASQAGHDPGVYKAYTMVEDALASAEGNGDE